MSYEIDYIPVGTGERSGDAICLRFGNLVGQRHEQTIVVIDGGTKESGQAIVDHINTFYNAEGRIDYVVSTHPDSDHSSGLRIVLEHFDVGTLLMHLPWNHASEIKNYFADERWTNKGLSATIRKSMRYAKELEAIAIRKNVPIVEPFTGIGSTDGTMTVLGPSKEFYQEMVVNFRMTPKPVAGLRPSLMDALIRKSERAISFIEDRYDIDILNEEDDTTSSENNSSVVILFNIDGHRLLFTGDAGKTALLKVIDYADTLNLNLTGLEFFDVPHHGSRRNLNSRVLTKINGIIPSVSASGENPKHPSKRVLNALKKFGAIGVTVNRKQTLLHHYMANHRGWYGAAPAEPWHDQVEE